jgi:hypothetical protein
LAEDVQPGVGQEGVRASKGRSGPHAAIRESADPLPLEVGPRPSPLAGWVLLRLFGNTVFGAADPRPASGSAVRTNCWAAATRGCFAGEVT